MKYFTIRIHFLVIMCFCVVATAKAQITIDNTTYSVDQLVRNVLIPASGVSSVSNVSFKGVYNSSGKYQIGSFTTATTTNAQMGISSGVVLSTGNTTRIPLALGSDPGAATQMTAGYPDGTTGEVRYPTGTSTTLIPDLVNLLSRQSSGSSNYYNAAVLEFDFVPISDFVQFRYIFGSEEYDDKYPFTGSINYNCSSYNDVFGFIISGPGISGGQGYTNDGKNIALLSNGSDVCINSVNDGKVGSSGGTPNASYCLAANPSWVQNVSTAEFLGTIDGTQLNGNTRVLIARKMGLIPGQTYHIKIMITDVKDAAYDSVVYLEAGSFITDPSGGALPLYMSYFDAQCMDDKILLQWQTSYEKNNLYFTVQQIKDGSSWTDVGVVNSHGINSSEIQNYSYQLGSNTSGKNYFRLKQVDVDGKITYSKIIYLDCGQSNSNQISIQQNGGSDITVNGLNAGSRIQLVSPSGQILLDKIIDSKQFVLNKSNYTDGIYYLLIISNGQKAVKKVSIFR